MSRTTPDAVKSILTNDYDSKRAWDLQPFIDTANVITNRIVATSSPYPSSQELELIERWLAAHCYCMSDQAYLQKKTGQASGIFQGKTGMRLEATKYGQQAMLLDWTGTLEALNGGVQIELTWAGKTASEAIDWKDRN